MGDKPQSGLSVIADKKPVMQYSNLKHVILKTDPETGKRYIIKDGRRIEVVSKIKAPNITINLSKLNLPTNQHILKVQPVTQLQPPPLVSRSTPPALAAFSKSNNRTVVNTIGTVVNNQVVKKSEPEKTLDEQIKPNIIIKRNQANRNIINELLKKSTVEETTNIAKAGETIKYHVLSLNVKKQGQIMSDLGLTTSQDKSFQTKVSTQDQGIQTDLSLIGEAEFPQIDVDDMFLKFFAETDPRNMLDPTKIRNKEELMKFKFFEDMKKAQTFDSSGNLPIHEGVMHNDLKVVKKNCFVLKALRKSVNIPNQQNYTPLHLAIINDNQIEIVNVLIAHGADMGAADAEGNNALHLAVEHNRNHMLRLLLGTAEKQNTNVDEFNYEGFTPLILSVLNKSEEQCRVLLQHGADPNVKDKKSGRTALFHAAETFSANLVKLLMNKNADTKIRNFFGTSAHDAMFEIDEMPIEIKLAILGRDHQKYAQKRKLEATLKDSKQSKLETTAVLKRVDFKLHPYGKGRRK